MVARDGGCVGHVKESALPICLLLRELLVIKIARTEGEMARTMAEKNGAKQSQYDVACGSLWPVRGRRWKIDEQ